MTTHRSWPGLFARVLVFIILMPFRTTHAVTAAPSETTADGGALKAPPRIGGHLPLRFERAAADASGQWFVARGAGYLVGVGGNEARLVLRRSASKPAAVTMRLVGSRTASSAAARKPQPRITNHLSSNDPSEWRLDVSGYAEVEYRDVYPGVSVLYYGTERQLEYDFVVAPGATPKAIALAFEGSKGLRIDRDGRLVIATDAGDLIQRTPVLYQDINGARHRVEGGYVIRRDQSVGFTVGKYDAKYPLVIDPILSYCAPC